MISGTLGLFFLFFFSFDWKIINGLDLWLFLQIEGNGGIREFNVVLLPSVCCDSFASRNVQREIGVFRVVYHTWRLHQLCHISCFADGKLESSDMVYHISYDVLEEPIIKVDAGLFLMFFQFRNIVLEVQKSVEQNCTCYLCNHFFFILINSFSFGNYWPKLVVFTNYSVLWERNLQCELCEK